MESLAQTEADMRSAVFCVCPPGARVSGPAKNKGQDQGYISVGIPMESLAQTEADMRSAIFCVCPPGARSSVGQPKIRVKIRVI